MRSLGWSLKPLSTQHTVKHFKCGKHELDLWLQRWAHRNQATNATRTTVLVDDPDPQVRGFYSLSATVIEIAHLPPDVRKDLGLRYPAPAVLLAQLAVHRDLRGQGWGKALLVHALRTALDASTLVGAFAVAVDAVDEEAQRFYEKYDFLPLDRDVRTHGRHLFLPMSAIPRKPA